ncbi:MAG: hypothetical protein Q4G49_12845 [Paracoccus sp. (in: a-proteobacteria)]|nr:hypothetical protein [Paracoccus sp. (in: a-proteobacteria)]
MIADGTGAAGALSGTRPIIFNLDGISRDTPVCHGEKMGTGDESAGPAVIQKVTTTLVVEPGWTARLDKNGVYVITADA